MGRGVSRRKRQSMNIAYNSKTKAAAMAQLKADEKKVAAKIDQLVATGGLQEDDLEQRGCFARGCFPFLRRGRRRLAQDTGLETAVFGQNASSGNGAAAARLEHLVEPKLVVVWVARPDRALHRRLPLVEHGDAARRVSEEDHARIQLRVDVPSVLVAVHVLLHLVHRQHDVGEGEQRGFRPHRRRPVLGVADERPRRREPDDVDVAHLSAPAQQRSDNCAEELRRIAPELR